MRMLIFILVSALILGATPALAYEGVAPANLIFTPEGGGKFIYCNNEEALTQRSLSDTSNPNPAYIMNNDNLDEGKYTVYVSHINHTGEKDKSGKLTKLGFDIEVDIQIIAKTDTKINLTAAGFDVMSAQLYELNGGVYKEQSTWDLAAAWADYLQLPIYTTDISRNYYPRTFEPVEIELKAGEEAWLGQYMNGYKTVPYLKAVNMIADLGVEFGRIDLNIAALKHNGKLGDRTHHDNNADRGIYYRDKQYKGVADTLPKVNAAINYTIDDKVPSNTLLPVIIYNQYNPQGNTVEKWFTHINPQEDKWSKNTSAESDMLGFYYSDGEKYKYYRSNVPEKEKDDTWVFDVFHSDTKEETLNGIPNYKLSVSTDNTGMGANLGNYAVVTSYKVAVENKGDKPRWLNYYINSNSTNIVMVKDENGNLINDYAVRKNSNGSKANTLLASLELPPKEESVYYIEEILPANYPGGMENSLSITDSPKNVNIDKNSGYRIITDDYRHTGKEYYKFYDKKLYFSYDKETWKEQPIGQQAKDIFDGLWNDFDIKYLDGMYSVRWFEYDGAPFFDADALELCSQIHFFDKDFNLLHTQKYDSYPESVFLAGDKIVTQTRAEIKELYKEDFMPVITVYIAGNRVEFDVDPIIESGRTLVPIRAIFEQMGADVSWDEETRTAAVEKDGTTIVFTIDENTTYINGTEIEMDVPARQMNWRTLVPVRFLSENLGCNVAWNDAERRIDIEK